MSSDVSANWPRKRSWRWVAFWALGGAAAEFGVLLPYEYLVGPPPAGLIFILNSLWALGVGLAIRAARTRLCPSCGATAHTSTFRIGRRTCDRCNAHIR